MATEENYRINQNVRKSYLKNMTVEREVEEEIKQRNVHKGSEICDMVYNQNKKKR